MFSAKVKWAGVYYGFSAWVEVTNGKLRTAAKRGSVIPIRHGNEVTREDESVSKLDELALTEGAAQTDGTFHAQFGLLEEEEDSSN